MGLLVGAGSLAVCALGVCVLALGCSTYDGNLLRKPVPAVNSSRRATGSDGGSQVASAEAGVDARVADASVSADGAVPRTDAAVDASVVTATSFDPSSCAGGECWWSHASDGCKSTGLPGEADRPGAEGDAQPLSLAPIYLGWTKLRLGTTLPDGTPGDSAWQGFGLDLDGVCTNSATCSGVHDAVSCHSTAAQIPFDGELCRDNTFASLQPVVAKVPELGIKFGLSEDVFNCNLWRGSYNVIVRISDYNGSANDSHVRVDWYTSDGLESQQPWQCPLDKYDAYPLWRASATWHIDQNALTAPISTPGELPDSMIADPQAYVKNGYLVSRVPDGTTLRLTGDAKPYRGFPLTVYRGLWIGNLWKAQDDTWRVRDGLTAGATRTEDLLRSFREIGLCEGTGLDAFYQSVTTYVNENADLLASGAVDPSMPCDAMSLGIAFEAAQVTPGAAGAIEPLIECCPPGSTIEQCQAKCGDGKVSGDEICDTAIAATATGGCPTTCPAVDACTPQIVAGSACTSLCVAAPITTPKSGDGCCPPGADATQDGDCPAICGNGVVEPGETCDPMASCMSCGSTDPCLTPMASGSAQTCDAACKLVEITLCQNGDLCCPNGCNRASDNDCPAGCGNGVIEVGETCEAGTAMPCPATCDDGKSCTVDQRTGSVGNCNVVCTHTAITQVHDGDGCCPPGANLNTDKDCMAICGNKVVEPGEQCDDGNQVAGDGCLGCKTETQEQICRVKIGKSDACALCSCANCTQNALACYGASSASDVMLCDGVAQCGLSSHCHGIECYCGIGQTDAFLCLLLGPVGPCKPQIERAANSTDPLTIQSASTDSSSPLGRADMLGECAYSKCATECGF